MRKFSNISYCYSRCLGTWERTHGNMPTAIVNSSISMVSEATNTTRYQLWSMNTKRLKMRAHRVNVAFLMVGYHHVSSIFFRIPTLELWWLYDHPTSKETTLKYAVIIKTKSNKITKCPHYWPFGRVIHPWPVAKEPAMRKGFTCEDINLHHKRLVLCVAGQMTVWVKHVYNIQHYEYCIGWLSEYIP